MTKSAYHTTAILRSDQIKTIKEAGECLKECATQLRCHYFLVLPSFAEKLADKLEAILTEGEEK